MLTPSENPKDENRWSKFWKDVGSFLLLVSLPWFIGLSCWYFLSSMFRFYKLNGFLFYGVFVLIVSVVSLLSNMLIVQTIEWSKEPVGKSIKVAETKGKRIIKIVLTGVLVPIILSVAANLIPVSNDQTFVTILLNRMKYGTEYPFISKIGDVSIASGTDTKVLGISTLNTIHSTKSLDELFRIFVEDHQALNDYEVYSSLSRAMASFPESRDRLLEMFFQSDEFKSNLPRGITPGLYNRYFSQAFGGLRDEITKNVLDEKNRNEQLLLVEGMELQIKTSLTDMENQKVIPEGSDPTLDFVLDTFLKMQIAKDDSEIYFLARNIAVDPTYAVGTRIKAIDLWAKLGNTGDFEKIILFLDSDDEQIRQAALQAIATIHEHTQNQNAADSENK